jgi:hypothetical protein
MGYAINLLSLSRTIPSTRYSTVSVQEMLAMESVRNATWVYILSPLLIWVSSTFILLWTLTLAASLLIYSMQYIRARQARFWKILLFAAPN